MKKISVVLMALCAIVLGSCATAVSGSTVSGDVDQKVTSAVDVGVNVNLNFRGWYPWGGIQAAPNGNTVTFNGNVGTAGYVTENLNISNRNRRVVLEINNIAASNFSEDRMIKITVNKNDQIVHPLGITDLIQGEYIPVDYNTVKFILPPDFDGKLGFVFYQADLKNLQITARYE